MSLINKKCPYCKSKIEALVAHKIVGDLMSLVCINCYAVVIVDELTNTIRKITAQDKINMFISPLAKTAYGEVELKKRRKAS